MTDYLSRLPADAREQFVDLVGFIGSPYGPESSLIALAYGLKDGDADLVAKLFGDDHVDAAREVLDTIVEECPPPGSIQVVS